MRMQTLRVAAVAVAMLSTPAMALTVGFSGTGNVLPVGPPDGAGNLPLAVIDTAYEVGASPAGRSRRLSSSTQPRSREPARSSFRTASMRLSAPF